MLLIEENSKLKEKVINLETIESSMELKFNDLLSKYFTPGQIKSIRSNGKRVAWASEDIASAITLRSVSKKGYRYLRETLKYPLPALSTLRNWATYLDL